MRLIDADVLKQCRGIAGDPILHEIIDSQPTIEAEPAKHGRWLYNDMILNRQKCSECGFYSDDLQSDNYCPNCGVKMYGGIDNETG